MLQRIVAGFLFATATVAPQVVYRNPVIDGDFPDPSVIRVENRKQTSYWATTTGGVKAVGAFPLFHSPDLVHWHRAELKYVLPNPPGWTQDSYWAPEISEHGGRFYVFYSAVCDMSNPDCQRKAKDSKNPHCLGFATASSPGGPYRDFGQPLVCDEWGSIDPMALWDGRKAYLIWKEDVNHCHCPTPSRIWGQEFSITDEPKFIGPKRLLLESDIHSWEDAVVEGPFILKHNGLYYLFYSAASYGPVQHCNYALGVARPANPIGPYVKDPANPLASDNASWKCPGHGSIVMLADGQTFLLYHAYPRKPQEENHRDTVLDEVEWKPDGWPVINDYRGVGSEGSVPDSERKVN